MIDHKLFEGCDNQPDSRGVGERSGKLNPLSPGSELEGEDRFNSGTLHRSRMPIFMAVICHSFLLVPNGRPVEKGENQERRKSLNYNKRQGSGLAGQFGEAVAERVDN